MRMRPAQLAARRQFPFIPVKLYVEPPLTTKRRRVKGTISFTSDDPQLSVKSSDDNLAQLSSHNFVCGAAHVDGAISDPCLYIDRGDGFTEQPSSKIPAQLYRYGNVLVFVASVGVAEPLKAFRFDLSHSRCNFKLIGAGWTDEDGTAAILDAASRLRFAPFGARAGRMIYRLLPTGKSTKNRWARRLFPRSWLQAIEPSIVTPDSVVGNTRGASAVAHRNRFESVYWANWNQALGTGHEHLRGALSVRPVRAELCDVKLIAYYLPQFHPIPENDAWWGRGFTEWRNVAKAVPVFAGHYQPRLPGELGFYDLRVLDVMRRQVELAWHYGISAFCFHFYWFGGKRLLETPVLSYLERTELDLPFCLCWANENWTRRWDGADDEVLIGQQHSAEDDVAFIRYLKRYFDDPRYLKIDGKPVLTVYRPSILPNARKTAERWREEAAEMGFPGIYLVATNSFGFSNHESIGFDALSEFPPHGVKAPVIRNSLQFLPTGHRGRAFSYADVAKMEHKTESNRGTVWPGVMPGWDNSARRPNGGHIFHDSTPWLFREWLDKAIVRARRNPSDERFVVINAWNEWAEGAYLEPDQRFGYAYLAACGSAVTDSATSDPSASALFAEMRARYRAQHRLAVVLHLFYENLTDEFASCIEEFGKVDVYITTPKDISPKAAREIAAKFPTAYVQEVENRGRDMLPFLSIFDVVRAGNHDFVCKLHTKRSPHIADGDAWRKELVNGLLSPTARELLCGTCRIPENVGILASRGSLATLAKEPVRRHSADRILTFAAKLGVEVHLDEPFVAGSMFWFRPPAMDRFYGLASEADFEAELGQVDGALAHALERMTIIAPRAAGYDAMEMKVGDVTARQY
jgi:lipopolysaccharide biosynthesis protein